MRYGVTLIEMIIVITVIGILTTTTITTFDSTRSRLLFQNKVAKVQDSMTLARNLIASQKGFTATDPSETEVINPGNIVWFDFETVDGQRIVEKIVAYATNDVNNDEYNPDTDKRIAYIELNSPTDDFLSITDYQFSPELEFKNDDLYVKFETNGSCGFNDPNAKMLQIPLRLNTNAESQPILRYLYFNKVACNPEILIDDLYAE